MVAILSVDGVQKLLKPDDTLVVRGSLEQPGATVTFTNVLFAGEDDWVKIGAPTVPGAKVVCEVVKHAKSPKLTVFKFRRRSNYRRKAGYREPRTWLKVKSVEVESRGA